MSIPNTAYAKMFAKMFDDIAAALRPYPYQSYEELLRISRAKTGIFGIHLPVREFIRRAPMNAISDKAEWLEFPKGESVTIRILPPKKRPDFVIHRTHADRPPTVTTMENYGEEVTTPGVAPDVMTKDELPPGYAVPCPRMVAVPMEKGTKCYLCARPLDYYFERSPGDYSKICSHCVWSHLRYEAVPDGQGQLRRIPDEEKLR